MKSSELIEWVLIDGWRYAVEIFDETLSFAGSVDHPNAPSISMPIKN
jgi:hypothetical protein